jgi:hypothetical protein
MSVRRVNLSRSLDCGANSARRCGPRHPLVHSSLSRGGAWSTRAGTLSQRRRGAQVRRFGFELDDRPAEGAKLVDDLEDRSAVASTPFGHTGLVDSASFPAPSIHDDFDRGIARKRASQIFIELSPITRDDEPLLHDGLLGFLPALATTMQRWQQGELPLVEKAGQWNPGVRAARGTRWGSDVEACLTIETEGQAAKG